MADYILLVRLERGRAHFDLCFSDDKDEKVNDQYFGSVCEEIGHLHESHHLAADVFSRNSDAIGNCLAKEAHEKWHKDDNRCELYSALDLDHNEYH